jgi:transcriptional regulator with XRE-family HTH domain
MEYLKTLSKGERIKYARGERTQKEVAEATGVSVALISRLENDDDELRPSFETMKKLSEFFGISVDRLFF